MGVITDGDIFRWRYKDEKPEHLRDYGRYHCKSRIAIAKGGLLIDTYWSMLSTSNSAYWPYADAARELELERLGNFANLEKRPEYHKYYYADADVVDLSHANSSKDNLYVRKGAARCRAKMRAVMLENIATTERDLAYAQHKLERQRKTLAEVESAADLDEVYL